MKFELPNRLSEATIQAEFYKQAIEAGLNVYLEYRYEKSIFDAIIHSDNKIKFIIEIKSYKTTKPPKRNTKQIRRYESYGIEVLLISRIENIPDIIKYINNS